MASNKKLYVAGKEFALTPEMKQDLYNAYPALKQGRSVLVTMMGNNVRRDLNTGTLTSNLTRNIGFKNTVPFDGKRVVTDLRAENSQLVDICVASGFKPGKNQEPIWSHGDLYLVANPNIELDPEDLVMAYFVLMVSGEVVGNSCPEGYVKKYRPVKVYDPTTVAATHVNRDKVVQKAKGLIYNHESEELIRALAAHMKVALFDLISRDEIESNLAMMIDSDKTTSTAERMIEYLTNQNEYKVADLIAALKKENKMMYDATDKTFYSVKDGEKGGVIQQVAGVDPDAELEAALTQNAGLLKILSKKL